MRVLWFLIIKKNAIPDDPKAHAELQINAESWLVDSGSVRSC